MWIHTPQNQGLRALRVLYPIWTCVPPLEGGPQGSILGSGHRAGPSGVSPAWDPPGEVQPGPLQGDPLGGTPPGSVLACTLVGPHLVWLWILYPRPLGTVPRVLAWDRPCRLAPWTVPGT